MLIVNIVISCAVRDLWQFVTEKGSTNLLKNNVTYFMDSLWYCHIFNSRPASISKAFEKTDNDLEL